jgi:hypothetical protein
VADRVGNEITSPGYVVKMRRNTLSAKAAYISPWLYFCLRRATWGRSLTVANFQSDLVLSFYRHSSLKSSYLFSALSLPSVSCMKSITIICCWLWLGQVPFVSGSVRAHEIFSQSYAQYSRGPSSATTGGAAYRGIENRKETRNWRRW